MRKYPFTPDLLDALPEELAELYRGLEDTLLQEICSRLNLSGQLNEVTVQGIRALRSHGIPPEDIKKAIAKTTNISMEKLDKLLDDVVERNQRYYTEVIDLARVTMPEILVDATVIAAIRKQTRDELRNITRSMGFLVSNGKTMLPPAKAYQWALDQATLQIESGAISYNQAVESAIRALAKSGLCVARDKNGNLIKNRVQWESGHIDHLDVSIRRAVMTGINQLNQQYREQSMDYLDTNLVEVSAHQGARDTGKGYFNHKSWQGKIYHWRRNGGYKESKYPDFEEVCGYGEGGGIGGWNCRHSFYPFVEGVMEPTYSQKDLDSIDPPPFEYQGVKYDAYQATQKQREIERSIRKQKRLQVAFKAQGNEAEASAAGSKLRALNQEYKKFSAKAKLPEQRERTKVLYK